jgi:purine nucleosidase
MKRKPITLLILSIMALITSCNSASVRGQKEDPRIPVIIDSDANNELDDQHALAYLLLNDSTFNALGITVNATYNGGEIEEHQKEANRVVDLVGWKGKVQVYKGANANFTEIEDHLNQDEFDGSAAVGFIIEEAMKKRAQPLVLIPVGKLTNIALALKKEPAIAGRVRIVWLGSNYPEPGEYNLENDTAALNFILKKDVPFEMATVRYGESSGTADVKVRRREIYTRMPGSGPVVAEPVTGRHGGTFTCFGDYSVDLFKHITDLEDGCYRSLFDMAAVAIVKNPSWAEKHEVPCPLYFNDGWVEQPGNDRTISVWENFNSDAILNDFFTTIDNGSVIAGQ